MSYEDVLAVISEKNLSWANIDRIHLTEPSLEEFRERASFRPSDATTDDRPAVRLTKGDEKIFFVRNGDDSMQEVALE